MYLSNTHTHLAALDDWHNLVLPGHPDPLVGAGAGLAKILAAVVAVVRGRGLLVAALALQPARLPKIRDTLKYVLEQTKPKPKGKECSSFG